MKIIYIFLVMILSYGSFATDGWPKSGSSGNYTFSLDNIQPKDLYLEQCRRNPQDQLASLAYYKHYSIKLKSLMLNKVSYRLKSIDVQFDSQFCDERIPGKYSLNFEKDHQKITLNFMHNPYYPGRFEHVKLIIDNKNIFIKISELWQY